ncbi:MAG: hypothetical protein V4674_01745 [Patescibacteria group bacterium]
MTRTQQIAVGTVVVAILAILALFFVLRSGSGDEAPQDDGSGIFPVSLGKDVSGVPARGAPAGTGNTGSDTSLSNGEPSPARKLFTAGVASAVAESGDKPSVRFIERSTGHIFEASPQTGDVRKLSNTTVRGIVSASWSSDGKLVAISAQDPETGLLGTAAYALPAATSTEITIIPTAFPRAALDFTFSPDGKKAFVLLPSGSGVVGQIFDMVSKKSVPLFSSPLTEWNISWTSPGTILLGTKASSGVEGAIIALDVKTGAQTELLGELPGIVGLLSPSGKELLYSQSSGNSLSTAMLDVGKSSRPYPITTFPEKCRWTQSNALFCAVPTSLPTTALPDAWYKGLFHTNDELWRFSEDGDPELVLAPEREGIRELLDITKLTIDTTGSYLYFINKLDGALWSVEVR